MIGKNEFRLNKATMMRAVQDYLENEMSMSDQKVVDLRVVSLGAEEVFAVDIESDANRN